MVHHYKKYLLIILTLILCQTAFAQHSFIKLYNNLPDFQANDIKHTTDSGFIIAGSIYSSNGGNFFLFKTDSIGNIIWLTQGNRFDGLNWINGTTSIEVKDGYFYLLGYCRPMAGGDFKIYLVKVDSIGNIVWDKALNTNGSSGGMKIVKSLDGNFICTGYDTYGTIPSFHIWYCKIDTAGNYLWNSLLSFPSNTIGKDIKEFDNKLIISAIGDSIDSSSSDIFFSNVIQTDSSQNLYWNYSTSDTIPHGIAHLAVDSINVYAAEYFYSSSFAPGYYKSAIHCLNASGNLLWTAEIPNSTAFNMGIDINTAGNVVTSFNSNNVLVYNIMGDSLKSYRDTGIDYKISNLIAISENKYALVGYDKSGPGHPYISYLKLIDDTTSNSINEYSKNKNLNFFPNPFVNYLQINFDSPDKIDIEIYDINGHFIKEFTKVDSFTKINFVDLVEGIYLIFIYDNQNKKILCDFKVIKQ